MGAGQGVPTASGGANRDRAVRMVRTQKEPCDTVKALSHCELPFIVWGIW